MRSLYFTIRVLQQPNVFKSAMLHPFMRSWMEWVLSVESVSFWKRQKSKITAATHASSLWNSEHSNRSLFPKQKTQSLCFKPKAKMVAASEGFSGHSPPSKPSVTFLFIYLFTHQQVFFEPCIQALEATVSKNRLSSILMELTAYPSLHPRDWHPSITNKYTVSSCMKHKCGNRAQFGRRWVRRIGKTSNKW